MPSSVPPEIDNACRDIIRLIGECFPSLTATQIWLGPSLLNPDHQWTIFIVSEQDPRPDPLQNIKFRSMLQDYVEASGLVRYHTAGGRVTTWSTLNVSVIAPDQVHYLKPEALLIG